MALDTITIHVGDGGKILRVEPVAFEEFVRRNTVGPIYCGPTRFTDLTTGYCIQIDLDVHHETT